jgi:hypothetical protein
MSDQPISLGENDHREDDVEEQAVKAVFASWSFRIYASHMWSWMV